MHGGRASNAGLPGGGNKRVKIKNCDKEHEEHEELVKHYEVCTGWLSIIRCVQVG